MGFIKFHNSKKIYEGKVIPYKTGEQRLLRIVTENNIKNLSGLVYYKDSNGKMLLGDYSEFVYLYKENDGEIILSDEDAPYVEPEVIVPEEPVIPEPTLEEVKGGKIAELESEKALYISSGTSVELSTGTEHFYFGTEERLLLDSAYTNAKESRMAVPYYNANKDCKVYPFEDIVAIYIAKETTVAVAFALCHNLQKQVEDETDMEAVQSVTFDVQCLKNPYLENFNQSIAQAEAVKNKILENLEGANE